jgi:hypothetical protein
VRRTAGQVTAQIMLRSQRGKPVYLVYDEDAFLAAPDGALTVAPDAGSPSTGRPHALRRRWTWALAVTLAAATATQLVASEANHDRERPSTPTDDHARAVAHDRRPATTRVRRHRVERPVTSPSAPQPQRSGPRTEYHRHARHLRQPARPGRAALPAGSPRRAAGAAQPLWPPPRPRSATASSGPPGTGPAHEFGFEG